MTGPCPHCHSCGRPGWPDRSPCGPDRLCLTLPSLRHRLQTCTDPRLHGTWTGTTTTTTTTHRKFEGVVREAHMMKPKQTKRKTKLKMTKNNVLLLFIYISYTVWLLKPIILHILYFNNCGIIIFLNFYFFLHFQKFVNRFRHIPLNTLYLYFFLRTFSNWN